MTLIGILKRLISLMVLKLAFRNIKNVNYETKNIDIYKKDMTMKYMVQ